MLVQLAPPSLSPAFYPASVTALFEHDDQGKLLKTAEVYLDYFPDTRRVAAELSIHRSTLYYRLGRIETITGLGMSLGSDRLTLHLGIKVARLRTSL